MRVLYFDTETYLIERCAQAPKIVCLSYSFRDAAAGNPHGVLIGEDIAKWMKVWLKEAIAGRLLLVGHNVSYDMAVLLANLPELWDLIWQAYDADVVTCTMNRDKLLDICDGEYGYYIDKGGKKRKNFYSLAQLADSRLGISLQKKDTWRLRYAELDGVPIEDWPQEAFDYAEKDAIVTGQVYEAQEVYAKEIEYNMPTQFEETRADLALKLMSTWGILTDRCKVETIWYKTLSLMKTLAQEIENGGVAQVVSMGDDKKIPVVKKNMKILRGLIEKHYRGEPPTTPTGAIQTGAEVIEMCDHKALSALAAFSGLQKLTNTYLKGMFQKPIHASFYAIGAQSDRTSCSKPNLQNQPRLPGLRECFVPREGFWYLACDFDSQEMRTLAQACLDTVGHSKLALRYQKNTHFDPHLEFAAEMAGITPVDAAKLLEDEDKRIKTLRQQAKIANFGFPGGLGAKTFVFYAKSWGLDVTSERAFELRQLWLRQWAEMEDYFKYVNVAVGPGGGGEAYIKQSGFRRGDCGYTQMCNTHFQTRAAHASKASLYAVSRASHFDTNSPLYGSHPVAFIHDENMIEVPIAQAADAADEIEKLMVREMERYTPDVPSAASATLMTCWSKSAKRVFDKEGRLTAWSPKE